MHSSASGHELIDDQNETEIAAAGSTEPGRNFRQIPRRGMSRICA